MNSIFNILLLPFRLVQGTISRDFSTYGKVLLSLTPSINTLNDHSAFPVKRKLFDRYGFWGYYSEVDGGMNFGAGYSFLPNFLMWKIGVSGYLLFTLLAYLFFFFQLYTVSSMPSSWLILLVGALVLYSPYFKNSTFVCGRHDIPGWALLFSGIVLMQNGYSFAAFVALSLAFMTHVSISIIGLVYFLCFIIAGSLSIRDIFIVILSQTVNLFWYIPFLKIYWQHRTHQHSWTPVMPDHTRTMAINIKKGVGMLVFILSLLLCKPDKMIIIFIFIPFIFFLINCKNEMLINRFAIELLWLCSTFVALTYMNSLWLCLPYLVSLYFYASPSPRFSFPFRPLLIDENELKSKFSIFLNELPDHARTCLITFPLTAEEWRINTKYDLVINNGLSLINKPIEYVTYMEHINEGTPHEIEKMLSDLGENYGISYFFCPILYMKFMEKVSFLKLVDKCTLPSIGTVHETDLLLYRITIDYPKILPEGDIRITPNGDLLIRSTSGPLEIKYRFLSGIKVLQNNKELKIEKTGDRSFFINSTGDSEIKVTYDTNRLWSVSKEIFPPGITNLF